MKTNLISTTVQWFDNLSGVGEGKTSNGQIVFLNSTYIEASSRFLSLGKGEKILCETQSQGVILFASKIVQENEELEKAG